MMKSDPVKETEKREMVVGNFIRDMDPNVMGIILVGSLTYAPNHDVKANSDVDLVIVYDNDKFKDSASKYFSKEKADYIKKQDNLDGFMSKNTIDGVDVSLHVINKKALDKIVSCESQDLRYYREKPKDFTYGVKDYHGDVYDFKPKTVPVKKVGGEIRVDNVSPPVSPNGPTIGNDMDKILSAGTILVDDDKRNLKKAMNKIWRNSITKYVEQTSQSQEDLNGNDFVKLLFRSDRFSGSVTTYLCGKTVEQKRREFDALLKSNENRKKNLKAKGIDLNNTLFYKASKSRV